MTAEQLEAARAERMRQNGHGAIAFEDVRTWVEETGLCVYLPRPTQAGQIFPPATPSFVEAVAGHRTPEPTLELIQTAESLLVRLEADGIAVRLNLAGQPGEQPDYIVAAWVLPYIYALRGDRDWRRAPQLTGSRQVSPLAVQVAKHLEPANLTAAQLRDQLGKEVTEAAVLRALHELWKQLRVIPIVHAVGAPALWQPLRQRFQKAIAEGASTSQVTAISVLASIYLQAVIAGSMEDVELFLSPLTSRSKIREVVRGLAATRQVHTTAMGHASLYYVAGTLPDFPAVTSYVSTTAASGYRSSYLPAYIDDSPEEDFGGSGLSVAAHAAAPAHATGSSNGHHKTWEPEPEEVPVEVAASAVEVQSIEIDAETFAVPTPAPIHRVAVAHAEPRVAKPQPAGKASAPRPRPGPRPARSAATSHPRERSRGERTENRGAARTGGSEWRRPPAPRGAASTNGSRSASTSRPGHSANENNGRHAGKQTHNGHSNNGHGNGFNSSSNGSHRSAPGPKSSGQSWGNRQAASGSRQPANGNGRANGHAANGNTTNGHAANRNGSSANSGAKHRPANARTAGKPTAHSANAHRTEARSGSVAGRSGSRPVAGKTAKSGARPAVRSGSASRKPTASASKRYSFAGQAKQAPKPAAKAGAGRSVKGKPTQTASRGKSARPAATAKRRG
ncbi:hypothetical protein ACFPT7_03165 [Acidicapsa dinghuensis]|uniref:Translation initiation factor IF-2 n=1 Tax=Acidicapsa dinghuensis TaxID=2218256 RepID=A0ABW1EE73_9BACT|nr:hypothetical protein [Acidicapsa dinghuensis]